VDTFFCGPYHLVGTVDQSEVTGRKFRGDEWDRVAVAAADLEDEITWLNIEELDGPDVAFRYLVSHQF
jgi:hypothetical protein